MTTLFKLLLLTIIVSSCLVSIFTFDLATLSVEVNGGLLSAVLENRMISGIIVGILLLGLVGQKMISHERTS